MEFVIYSDESARVGPYYSNFYGAALVRSTDLTLAGKYLNDVKVLNNLLGEIKWSKVTYSYVNKYVDVVSAFFDLIRKDKIKVRIMFTNNYNLGHRVTHLQMRNAYQILYYQFLKHSFAFRYAKTEEPTGLCFKLDTLPVSPQQADELKLLVQSIGRRRFYVTTEEIVEVNSHNHVVLQCLDIVLGAMYFRLNNLHKVRPPGSRIRGSRTRAKELLYKAISKEIRTIHPNFNIGISTGAHGSPENRWRESYRHWEFKPRRARRDYPKKKPK